MKGVLAALSFESSSSTLRQPSKQQGQENGIRKGSSARIQECMLTLVVRRFKPHMYLQLCKSYVPQLKPSSSKTGSRTRPRDPCDCAVLDAAHSVPIVSPSPRSMTKPSHSHLHVPHQGLLMYHHPGLPEVSCKTSTPTRQAAQLQMKTPQSMPASSQLYSLRAFCPWLIGVCSGFPFRRPAIEHERMQRLTASATLD